MTNTVPDLKAAPAKKPTLLEGPFFYLVYLVFYFTDWFFVRPSIIDIGAAIVAIGIFLPIYFRSYANAASVFLLYALAIEGIGLAVGPFNGMEGTFHIYAASIAGFQSNVRRAIAAIVGLSIIYALFAHFILDAHIARTGFVIVMSFIVGVGCIASAQSLYARDTHERSLILDRQLAAVEERERIARDLHDILGHTLTMVAVKADLADKLLDKDPAKARAEIADIRQTARDALSNVRDTVDGMTVITITEEVERARTSLAAMNIGFDVSGSVPDLPIRANKAVGLAIREAVTNIVRHSDATSVQLSFDQSSDMFSFTIVDNGKGAKPDKGTGETFEPGTGLQGLKRRISALGGKALIDMSAGTRLDVSVPLTEPGAL